MKIRLMALMVGALLVAAAVPAGAQHSYVANATATAFDLTLAENALTLGFTEANVQSGPTQGGCEGAVVACAAAAAALEPFGETVRVHAPGDPGPKDSTALTIPEPLNQILAADVVTARALAAGLPNPAGTANAGEALIDVTLTQTLVENVPEVQSGLQDISDQLLGAVEEGDPTGEVGSRLKGTVDAILDDLDSTPIAKITVGPSSSESTDLDGVTTATAAARGAVITVAPTPLDLPAAPEGLVIVEVGAASATATTDQLTGSAEFDPAIVRLRVFNPNTQQYDEVEVATGQGEQCAGQTPLLVCVTAGGGEVTQSGAAAAATASAVSVTLFEAPLPQISLDLAVASAGVNAAPPPAAPAPAGPPPAAVSPRADLPRTGAAAALPALALLGIGALGLEALRRRHR